MHIIWAHLKIKWRLSLASAEHQAGVAWPQDRLRVSYARQRDTAWRAVTYAPRGNRNVGDDGWINSETKGGCESLHVQWYIFLEIHFDVSVLLLTFQQRRERCYGGQIPRGKERGAIFSNVASSAGGWRRHGAV